MTTKKMVHERIGMVNENFTEITGYAHQRHKVGECPWCDYVRVESITKEFLWRLDNCGTKIRVLYMWSLGTSLTDTKFNRKLLLRHWRLFDVMMNKTESWNPIFRIVEKGRRGFLHIHVVCRTFCEHRIVLKNWRFQTGEKSNVHVSGYKGFLEPSRLARYLMKYLTKESSAYRWLGCFYGLGKRRSSSVRLKRTGGSKYGGVVYGGQITEAYEEYEPQQHI